MNGQVIIKVVSAAATVIGMASTIAGNWASAKQMDNKINEKVAEAVAEALKKGSN